MIRQGDTVFVVTWQDERTWVFEEEKDAIEQVVSITGKPQYEWGYDTGDTDEDGRMVSYEPAEVW